MGGGKQMGSKQDGGGAGAQDPVDHLKCRDVLALELYERHPDP